MNADTAYAIWRSCFDGYETWLNTVEHVGTYQAGDEWGCVGRWFAGRWHTALAQQYIRFVKKYLRERIWTQPDFQSPSRARGPGRARRAARGRAVRGRAARGGR